MSLRNSMSLYNIHPWFNKDFRKNIARAFATFIPQVLLLATGIIVLCACAKIGSPPGGPEDKTPPKVEKSKPLNYSTSYSQKKIVITFDEYINLKNTFSEVVVSPPLEENLSPLIRGKSIFIKLPAKNLDSLTYTIDFGQSIEDNNEGNKLPNYQFVISKDSHIDSFSVTGVLLDAFTKLPPEKPLFVQLRKNMSDTAFHTVIPTYHGKTNKNGEFTINHIAPGAYNIFALKDANSNMLFDLPNEIIAFNNNPLTVNPDSFDFEEPTEPKIDIPKVDTNAKFQFVTTDSTLIDSISAKLDSLKALDSLRFKFYRLSTDLFYFTEAKLYKQYLDAYNRDEPEYLKITFGEGLDTPPEIKLLKPDTIGTWHFLESNNTLDTLTYWLADSNLVFKDSILVEIKYPKTDSLGELITYTDTLLFRSKRKPKTDKEAAPGNDKKKTGLLGKLVKGEDKSKDSVIVKPPRVEYQTDINQNGHDLHMPIHITFDVPVYDYNRSLIELVTLDDTIEVPVNFSIEPDSSHIRKFVVNANFESEAAYKLKLYEGAFTDIYGRGIDTNIIEFNSQSEDFYGSININLEDVNTNILVQLLSDKEVVLDTRKTSVNDSLNFSYLKPGKYFVKLIFDDNMNGKWDPGLFKERVQPERVEYFPQIIDLTSNSSMDYIFKIPKYLTGIRPGEGMSDTADEEGDEADEGKKPDDRPNDYGSPARNDRLIQNVESGRAN